MKKTIVFSFMAVGILTAQTAFGAVTAPLETAQMGQSGSVMVNSAYGMQADQMHPVVTSIKAGMPCGVTPDSDFMAAGQAPCGNVMFTTAGFNRHDSRLGAWFALMIVLTVMMVWAVLLLLIGVLWNILKKQRKCDCQQCKIN
jgi:hypothetical protein